MLPSKGVALKDFRNDWFALVLFVAMLFSFNGGYINAVAFAGVWHTGLTHLTGSTTNSAIRFINAAKPGQYTQWDLLAFVLFFFLGSFVSGLVLGPPRLRWGRLQGACMAMITATIGLGWYLAPKPGEIRLGVDAGMAISFAMGMQNSVTSNFTPMVIRTSHVSGTVLDIGLALGQCIRMRNLDNFWKVKFHLPNYVAFWVGALVGCIAYNHWAADALLANVAACLIVTVATFVLCTLRSFWGGHGSGGAEIRMEDADVAEEEEEETLLEDQTMLYSDRQQHATTTTTTKTKSYGST